jgi:hypothetical protein
MKLFGSHFLVFDSTSLRTQHLKARLVREGARVSVTNSVILAITLLQDGGVQAAFVPYRSDAGTRTLCSEIRRLQIPVIFIGCSPRSEELRAAA